MVHIDPATLKRYPLAGVILGLMGATVALLVARDSLREMRTIEHRQRSVSAAALHSLAPGRAQWVRLSDCLLACAEAVTEKRDFPESLLFGRIESTQVPLQTALGSTIVKFAAEASCRSQERVTLAGVLVEPGNGTWGSSIEPAFRDRARPIRVLVVDATPSDLKGYLLFAGGLGLVSLGMSAFYGRIYLRRRPAAETAGPLHPSDV